MARKELILDDLDGSEGARPIQVTVGNDVFDIDLTEPSIEKLYKALSPFTKVARHRVRGGGDNGNNGEVQQVRAWAKANGYEVGDKGRIPQEVQEAYNAAQAAAQQPAQG